MSAPSPLVAHLLKRIALEGPLTIQQYMEECLGHPAHGYYMTRDPFGRSGDFITAPEISQMFGEILGLWSAVVWNNLGKPPGFHLVELGPGRGTLMADALRAAAGVPGFVEAAHIHLVETSPILRKLQEQALGTVPSKPVQWWNDLSQVPPGPMIVLANEFFDALPIRQFMKTEEGWRERVIAVAAENGQPGLAAGLSPAMRETPLIPAQLRETPVGSAVEVSPVALRKMHTLAARLKSVPGAALIIDYGHTLSAPGDTLQAVNGHDYADILDSPGEVDLTTHVDFQALRETATAAGAAVDGAVAQGEFLARLGLRQRAQALLAGASDQQAEQILAARDRLIGGGSDGMGRLFKVLGIRHPGLPKLPGLE